MVTAKPRSILRLPKSWRTRIKPADLKKAVDAVKQYKADMIKAWNEYFDEN